MKKILLTLLASFGAFFIYGQVSKGNFMAGGSLAFQSSRYSENDNSVGVLNLSPGAGYFFIERGAAGIRASFRLVSNDGDRYREMMIGPFARYYFLPTTRKTNLFLEANFMVGNEKYENFEAETKTEIGVSAGPSFFLNEHIAIESILGWRRIKYENDLGHTNVFGIGIGFQVYLNCNKDKQGK
jgi:hypothetical protein